MTANKKYSYEECGYSDYDAASSIASLIKDEFESRLGRRQSDALSGQFPRRKNHDGADEALVKFITKFNLTESSNEELRDEAVKLLGSFIPCQMKGMRIQFTDRTPHPEDVHSYRHYELLIFGEANYISVMTRKHWVALTKDKCVLDEDGEPTYNEDGEYVIRADVKGEPYDEGHTEWCVRSHHDSCWREGVERFFRETPHLGRLCGIGNWYEEVVIDPEGPEIDAIRNRENLKSWHFDEDHNYIGGGEQE